VKEGVPTQNRKRPGTGVTPAATQMGQKNQTLAVKGQLTNAYNTVAMRDYISPNYAHGNILTQPTLVPNTSGKTYQLKLKLLCEVGYNQRICVIGSLPELGNW
jgi:hypothetical protein